MPMARTFSVPESIRCDGCDERRVDAAAQGDEGFAEAAFADVVAGAQDQSMIGGFSVVVGRIGDCGRTERIDDHEVFFKRFCLRDEVTVRVYGDGGAIEDEAVVAADLIAHEHGDAVATGNGGQHLAADFALGMPERATRTG